MIENNSQVSGLSTWVICTIQWDRDMIKIDSLWRSEGVKNSSSHILYLRIQLKMDVQILRKQFGYTSINLKGSDRSCIRGNHEHIEVDIWVHLDMISIGMAVWPWNTPTFRNWVGKRSQQRRIRKSWVVRGNSWVWLWTTEKMCFKHAAFLERNAMK